MVLKLLSRALLFFVLLPQGAHALGLGDIRLNSALNAPLDAQIELTGATPEELGSLSPQLASRDTFTRYGLEWPAVLGSVTIEREQGAGGRNLLRLRSTAPVTEPFLTLLVEVNWARGRLVREYTVLLDPPVFAPNVGQSAPAVAAPATGGADRAGQIDRPAPQAPGQVTEPSGAQPGSASPQGDYTVRRGDTLSSIASRLASGDANRMMVGLFQQNPAAFDGNMNDLRSGAVLRMPDSATLAAISSSDAAAEVRRQYAGWRGRSAATQGGAASGGEPERLRLLPPGQAGAGAGSPDAAAGVEVRGLQDRVRQLESELDESRRLIELRNAELAQLQARLAGAQTQTQAPAPSATPEPAPATPDPMATAPDAVPPDASQPVDETTEAPPVAEDESAPAAPAATDDTTPAVAAEDTGSSLLDTLRGLWYIPLLLVLALAGLFGYRKWRERQAEDFDDSLGRLAAAGAESMETRGLTDTARLRKPMPTREDESFLVEESGTHERPHLGAPSSTTSRTAKVVTTEAPLSGDTAINLDQGDPLAEADFHMAYGLYDQAADLVRIAIQREPQRRDLKLKLLEVFFVWGNKDQFLQTARDLASTRDQAPAGEWEKIVIMGKQLAAEDALFAQTGSVGGAVAGGIDLDLEGGQNRVDYDLLGDMGAEPPRQGVDLDFNTALGADDDKDSTGEAPAMEPEDLDFVLDDPTRGSDQSGNTTREMTATMPSERGLDEDTLSESGDAPTVEQPALRGGDNPTIRQKVDMALRQGGAAEQTAELAIDDLGLDLGALDNEPTGGNDAPTMVAGLDDRSRRIMEDAERRATGNDEQADEWLPVEASDSDLETGRHAAADPNATAAMQALPDQSLGDGGETSRLAALRGDDLDMDFGSDARPGDELDLDVGPAELPDSDGDTFAATQKVGPEDLALPDLEPVTMSEVGTKLDLARAYMDMGDPDGARSILKEVLQEGSVSQKQEAQRLIDALPG